MICENCHQYITTDEIDNYLCPECGWPLDEVKDEVEDEEDDED